MKYGEVTMRYGLSVIGEPGENGYPLYVAMHGGGFGETPDMNNRQWGHMAVYYKDSVKSGVYVNPRGVRDTWDTHGNPESFPLYDRLVENMIVFYNVDPNKVYFLGFSAGGDGVYIVSPRMADRLAATHMSAGHHNGTSVWNLRNTPIQLQVGINDKAFDRHKVTVEYQKKMDEMEKKYGGYSAIRSIYEEYNNNGFNLNFSQLKNVITNGIVSNGYSSGTFDDAYVDMATYLIDPSKHFATLINNNTSLVDINTNDYILSNSNNNTTIVDNDTIKSYASSYYYFEVDDSLLGDSTLTLIFGFSFDISGAQIQLYTVDYSNNEYISYNAVYNNNKTITLQNVGTSIEKVFFVVSNLNESSEIEMDIDVSYTHTHNHLNGCTSNGAINHTCICSCGHTYTTAHTFKPFSNGNKCTGCGFFTTGPVITPIMGIVEEEPEEE